VGADACVPNSGSCDLSRGVVTNERARTVTFHLREADPSFLANLTTGGLVTPVPSGTPLRPAEDDPIPGTGPYMIASVDEQQIHYVRNPYFREWSRAAKPDGNPDEIVMRFEPQAEELVRAVEEGRADWLTESVPASRRTDLGRRFPGQLHSNEAPLVQFFQFDTTLPPFDDVRVRQALNFAFDREAVVRSFGGKSAATPTCQVLPPGIRGYRRYCPYTRSPRSDGRWSAPDPARARRLVAASGTKGERVVVWGITDDPNLGPRISRLVASTLRDLGYRTSLCLVPSSFSPIPPGCDPSKIQLGPAGWLDVSAYGFFGLWVSCGGANNRGYCDPVLDVRMQKARVLEATDPRAAARMWERIDHDVADRALWLPIVNSRILDFVSARVRNHQYHPYWGFLASQAWLQ
jgi:peptide/nickel transport system substrate-binding protein